MLFIDASIVVAILTNEEDAADLLERMQESGGPYYVSPIVRMEATLALTRSAADLSFGKDKPATPALMEQARNIVDQFLSEIDARDIPISGDIGSKALDAARQFGRYVAHPARLNMGDCYSYACAKACRTQVAYKGKDFVHTDIGWHTH